MPDESKLRRDAETGERARRLVEDPLLASLFDQLEAGYVRHWTFRTAVDDTAGRERLWQAVQIITRVREHLKILAADGRLAETQLAELAQGALVKPRA